MKKAPNPGPVYLKDNIPYDYIVIIDSGSSGSRVYVYNWLNPVAILNSTKSFEDIPKVDVKLVREEAVANDDQDSEDQPANNESPESENIEKPSARKFRVPQIQSHKKWNRKIKPGISTYSSSIQKVGKHHLRPLLQLASTVVPKSQHSRTPIFLHSTAGMRLLDLSDKQSILNEVCNYLTKNSDFYLPDCPSHVNVLDGDIEGLYGWLAVNYLQGSMDHPEDHQHGKGHTTYGLLDMGGASTQVVFLPNKTEIDEHQNNLYHINLYQLPKKEDKAYKEPEGLDYKVYSDSFLGFGMFQAHTRYLNKLADAFAKDQGLDPMTKISMPISDPCLPKGYTYSSLLVSGHSADFTGSSDFPGCLKAIFSVISDKSYGSPTSNANSNCKQLSESNAISSCLHSDLRPAFDFDVNHFVGVSGYWDAINSLFDYEKDKRDGLDYDYKKIYKQTQSLCLLSFRDLKLRSKALGKKHLEESDLSNLCFKSSWILNFLHQSLGFPRFGIDSEPKKSNRFKSLQLVNKVGGLYFSWTLGRAILYANDEYTQAFNNYAISNAAESKVETLRRPGFYHSASKNAFSYGAEQQDVFPRLEFTKPDPNTKFHYYDYETDTMDEARELKWHVQPHRWYGAFIFMSLIVFILWLMLGKSGRGELKQKASRRFRSLQFWKKSEDIRYEEVSGFELRDLEDDV